MASEALPRADKAGFRTVALVVSSSLFIQYFDSTALITALPAIARSFGRPVLDLNILISCYALAVAVLIPICSVLAGRLGAKRAFLMAMGVFLAGSVCSALSFNLPSLLCARMVQAAGAAMTLPVGRLIVVRSSRPSELVDALNWLLIPSVIGPVIGPPVSGFLVTYGAWQWVFLVIVPIGLAGIVLAWKLIPEFPPEPDYEAFDRVGAGILALTLGAFTFGFNTLVNGQDFLLASAELAASIVLARLYIHHAAKHPAPLLRLALLRIATFRQSMAMGSLLRAIAGAASFLVPLLLQLGFGMSAAASGAIAFALPAGALASRLASNWTLRMLSLRSMLIVFTVCTALAMGAVAFADPDAAPLFTRAAIFVLGFVSTMPLTVVSAVAYVDVPERQARAATGFYTTVQQLTISVGVMMATGLVRALQWSTGLGSHTAQLYAFAILGLAIVTLVGAVMATRFSATAGESLRPGRA